MSHELRTPLNSLLILSKLLADNPEHNLSDKQIEFARTIHQAGSDLLALISDILDLSKVEAGKMDIHPAPLPLTDVRDYVDRAFRSVAEEKGLTFGLELDEDAPASLITDEQRLQQVLRNLLSNAFKFTEAGEVKLRIGRGEGPYAVRFTVSDTGIGIPKDKLRLIFEAFQQADSGTSRRYGGTGLGLSISREIAALLGGVIEVTSTPGEGSAFTLSLPAEIVAPIIDPDEDDDCPSPARPCRPDRRRRRRRRRRWSCCPTGTDRRRASSPGRRRPARRTTARTSSRATACCSSSPPRRGGRRAWPRWPGRQLQDRRGGDRPGGHGPGPRVRARRRAARPRHGERAARAPQARAAHPPPARRRDRRGPTSARARCAAAPRSSSSGRRRRPADRCPAR
jgi:hypothetical protein